MPTDSVATVAQVCADLGANLVEVVTTPDGPEAIVHDVTLHDASEPIDPGRAAGHLLLAVGAGIESLPGLLVEAASAQVPAVACRLPLARTPHASDEASRQGITLLGVPSSVPWDEFYELVRLAVTANRPMGPGFGVLGRSWGEHGELSALLEAVAAITGGAAGIDDVHSRTIAFSGTGDSDPMRAAAILNRRVPAAFVKEL
jgi:hypothetical protein